MGATESQQSKKAGKDKPGPGIRLSLINSQLQCWLFCNGRLWITRGDTYWTYYPNPPTVIPTTWNETTLKVWVNTSYPLEGEEKNVQPQRAACDYTGSTHNALLCASHTLVPGCLLLGTATDTDKTEDSQLYKPPTGSLMCHKYHTIVSLMGLSGGFSWGNVSPPSLPSNNNIAHNTQKHIHGGLVDSPPVPDTNYTILLFTSMIGLLNIQTKMSHSWYILLLLFLP